MGYKNDTEQIIQIDNQQLQEDITSNSNKIGNLSATGYADLSAGIIDHTSQLADFGTNLTNYQRVVPEANDNGRFSRAIADLNYTPNTTVGWGSDSVMPFIVPEGNYQISVTLNIPSTFKMVGVGMPTIEQLTAGIDHFQTDISKSVAMNNIYVDGITFYKGRRAFYLYNHNEDNTQVFFTRCQFHQLTDYPIYTWSDYADNHQSTQLLIEKSKFMNCNGVLYSVCDHAIVRDTWVYVDKATFQTDRAVFVNAKPMAFLSLHNVAGVTTMGTDPNHISKTRWVDNYGHLRAFDTRFGGEDYGLPIVYQFGGNDSVNNPYKPNMDTSIIIQNSHCSAGQPSYNGGTDIADSGVIHLMDKVPAMIILEGNAYIEGTPYITKESTFDIGTYLTGFNGKQDDYFNIKIENNISVNTDVPADNQYAFPQELLTIVNKGENRFKGTRKYSFVGFGTGASTGIFYITLDFDPVENLSVANINIYGNPTPATNAVLTKSGDGLYYVTISSDSFTAAGTTQVGYCDLTFV